MLKMDLEYDKEVLFVRLNGNFDKKGCSKINYYLIPILTKHKIKYLIYNLANLKSISELGVDAILNSKCIIKKNNGKIFLCQIPDAVLLKLKRLHIKMVTTEKAALNMIEV